MPVLTPRLKYAPPFAASHVKIPEMTTLRLARSLVLAAASLAAFAVAAQTFPNKPIRIVTGSAGSNSDFVARVTSQALTTVFKQQVIVENRPSGVIPGEITAKAVPDGYTLVLSGASFWVAPLFLDKPPYDPVRDFTPVMMPVTTPNILVVSQALPVKNVKDLIALAKTKPGELFYSSSGPGTVGHLAGELLNSTVGIKLVHVPYKGIAPGVVDLIAGQVQLSFVTYTAAGPHIKTGRLRALGVTTAKRSPSLPDLPAIAEAVPGYDSAVWYGFSAPAGTPAEVVAKQDRLSGCQGRHRQGEEQSNQIGYARCFHGDRSGSL